MKTMRMTTRRGRRTRRAWIGMLSPLVMGTTPLTAQVPTSLLDRPARLEVEEVTLEEALRALHRASGVAVAFSPDRLPLEARVSCACDGLTVGQALDRLLARTDLEYHVAERQILIGRPLPGRGPVAPTDLQPASRGVIEGRVLLFPEGQPVARAVVTVSRTAASGADTADLAGPPTAPRGLQTDEDGRFTLALPPGSYHVVAAAFGATESDPIQVSVAAGQTTPITIPLPASPFRLDEIIVTPSTFEILGAQTLLAQALTREELESRPHPGNDVVRSVEQLPGISSTDYSAKPVVRGARAEEVLTVLDGLELEDPYHLKFWDGSLSIIDVETVGDVSLTTGGFTTEYGDKSAGVLAMRSADPSAGGPHTTVGLDFMSSIVKNAGTFDEGKGSWLASARRGFLGFVFDLMNLYPDEDIRPSYYDVFSKVEYEPRPGHRVSAHVLHAGDDNRGEEMDSTVYRIRYGNSYGWLSWEADLNDDLSARTVASVGRTMRDREGSDYWDPGDPPVLRIDDDNTTWTLGLRQDWLHRPWDRLMLKWGFDVKWSTSDYDYSRTSFSWVPNISDPQGPDFWPQHDTVAIATTRTGSEAGAYLASRVRVTEDLTVEAGARYDRQSHTGERQISPRIQAALRLTPRTELRGAWGHYYQSHGLNELWAADADTTYYPAQKAEHRVVGVVHRFGSGHSLRIEAYERRLFDPLPEYRRVARNMGALWEEALPDRVFVRPERGRAQGLELFVRSPRGGRVTWSGSYALSRAEDRVSGAWLPRPLDQRHAVNLQVAVRPAADWSLAAGWIYHSPWPYTEIEYQTATTIWGQLFSSRSPATLNQERLTPYRRLDFRASRRFQSGRGDVLVYLDVFNILDRRNAMDLEQSARWSGGRLITDQAYYPQLGILPSLGLKWTF